MGTRSAFLGGERHDDVALFLTESYLDGGGLQDLGESVDSGCVLVVPGDDGRRAFAAGTGMEAMEFARGAMETRGHISRDLDGGECPERGTDPEASHGVEFIFAFSEAQNEAVGGLYARGDVIHAYAHCACGTSYSDRWVVGEEAETGVQPGGSEPVGSDEHE